MTWRGLILVLFLLAVAGAIWNIPVLQWPWNLFLLIVQAVLGFGAASIGWLTTVATSAFASGVTAAASISIAAPVAAVGGVLGFVVVSAGTVVLIQPAVRAIKKHPYESLSPVVGVMSAFATDGLATAAGLHAPFSELVGVMNGLLVIGAGTLIPKSGLPTKLTALLFFAIIPGWLVGQYVTSRSADEIAAGVASLGLEFWIALAAVVTMAVACGALAIVAHDDEPEPTSVGYHRLA